MGPRCKLALALATSLALHASSALWLWRGYTGQPTAAPTLESTVTVDLVDLEIEYSIPVTPTAPTKANVPAHPGRVLAPRGQVRRGHAVSRSQSAPSAPPEPGIAHPGPGPATGAVTQPTDTLSIFRRLPGPELDAKAELADRPFSVLQGYAVPRLVPRMSGNAELPATVAGESGVRGTVGRDGSLSFRDPAAVALQGPGVRFDLNDVVVRAAGSDPYRAAKANLADATREQRLCLAIKDRQDRNQQALLGLQDRLNAIFQRTDLAPAERRRVAFELWDECLEGQADVGGHAAAARATILAVVRRTFPPGSHNAYSPHELTALNQSRTSQQRFEPYASPPDAAAP